MGGEVGPERLAGVAAGQGEANAVGVLTDPTADLEQAQAQNVELVGGRVALY